jgi:hypothetical protein
MTTPGNPGQIIYRLTFGGALGTSEQWQCTLRIGNPPVSPTQGDLDTAVTALNIRVAAMFAALATRFGNVVTHSFTSLYYYGSGQGSAATGMAHATVTLATGSTTPALPFQVACVASLRSNSPTRQARGRIYLPLLALVVPDGHYETADVSAIATAVAAMLTGMSADGFSVTAGTDNAVVTHVVVDNVPDTQRRRRNKLIGVPDSVAV